MPGPGRDVDRVPRPPGVAHAVDLGPARAFDNEKLRVPRMPVDGADDTWIDLVDQRVEAARRRIAVRAHVDAGAHAARRALQHHVILADHAAPVLAPILDELGAALFLDVVVRDRGGGLGRHFLYMEPCSPESARDHRIPPFPGQMIRALAAILLCISCVCSAQDTSVVLYTSLAPTESGPLGKAVQKKTGVRKGHVLFAELIAAGEIPVGLTAYNANAESLKRRGAPIDWVPVQPVVARPQGIGIARNAPNPKAATAFVDFVLSPEGQQLLESMGRVPVSTKVGTHMNQFDYTLVDSATVLDEQDKWMKEWDRLFIQK